MASFAWNPELDIRERYAGIDIDGDGLEAWLRLLEALFGRPGERGYLDAFSDFVLGTQALPGRTMAKPRVFISHRQVDATWGQRIAWLASRRAGLEYWLDVHDPLLRLAGAALLPSDPRYPLVVAAIIEMALLNSTHVIAAHTPNSAGSKWIPYELGRAKGRRVISRQAAGWFQKGMSPSACGEYVLLADICGSDSAVEQWLVGHARMPIVPKPYPGAQPQPLP